MPAFQLRSLIINVLVNAAEKITIPQKQKV